MKVLSYKIRVVVPGVDASVLRTSLADVFAVKKVGSARYKSDGLVYVDVDLSSSIQFLDTAIGFIAATSFMDELVAFVSTLNQLTGYQWSYDIRITYNGGVLLTIGYSEHTGEMYDDGLLAASSVFMEIE